MAPGHQGMRIWQCWTGRAPRGWGTAYQRRCPRLSREPVTDPSTWVSSPLSSRRPDTMTREAPRCGRRPGATALVPAHEDSRVGHVFARLRPRCAHRAHSRCRRWPGSMALGPARHSRAGRVAARARSHGAHRTYDCKVYGRDSPRSAPRASVPPSHAALGGVLHVAPPTWEAVLRCLLAAGGAAPVGRKCGTPILRV